MIAFRAADQTARARCGATALESAAAPPADCSAPFLHKDRVSIGVRAQAIGDDSLALIG